MYIYIYVYMKNFRLHIPVTLGIHWGGVCLGMCFLRKGKTTNTSFPYPPLVFEAIWEPEKNEKTKRLCFCCCEWCGGSQSMMYSDVIDFGLAWLTSRWQSFLHWCLRILDHMGILLYTVSFSSLLITPNAGYTREHCFMFILSLNIYFL